MKQPDPLRILGFCWALPNTLLGLLAALVWMAFGAKLRVVSGVLEVYGGWLAQWIVRKGGFGAMTLGHVILGYSAAGLDRLRGHEHVHVRQAERWGILFIPAYILAGLWQLSRGRHIYYDNPFEVEAFAAETSAVKSSTV